MGILVNAIAYPLGVIYFIAESIYILIVNTIGIPLHALFGESALSKLSISMSVLMSYVYNIFMLLFGCISMGLLGYAVYYYSISTFDRKSQAQKRKPTSTKQKENDKIENEKAHLE